MTGETRDWLRLSERLGMSLQQCQAETASSDFVLWKVHMEEDPNDFHAEHYYLAQIAFEIRQIISLFAKNAGKDRIEEFLIPFVRKTEEEEKKSRYATKEEASKVMKMTFISMAGPPG